MNLVPMKDLQLHLFKIKWLNNATRSKQLIPVGIPCKMGTGISPGSRQDSRR